MTVAILSRVMTDSKRGGKREGAGRKPTGAKLRSFRLTDKQYEQVKAFVKSLKAKTDQDK